MDVETEAAVREAALETLCLVLPQASRTALERALLAAGGDVDKAMNQLLSTRLGTGVDPDDCVVIVAPPQAAVGGSRTAPTPSLAIMVEADSAGVLAVEDDAEVAVQILQQILPHCPVELVRQVLQDVGNNRDAAMERLLGGASRAVPAFGGSESSTPRLAPVAEAVGAAVSDDADVLDVGTLVEVSYENDWYWASIQARCVDGTYRIIFAVDNSCEIVGRDRIKALVEGARVEVTYEGEWYWAEIRTIGVQDWTFDVVYEEDGTGEVVEHTRIKGQGFIDREAKLERVLPDCHPAHLSKILQEVGGNENAALERILSGDAYPKRPKPPKQLPREATGGGSSSSSSTAWPSSSALLGWDPEGEAPPEGRGAEYWFDASSRREERGRGVGMRCPAYRGEALGLLLEEFRELGKPGIQKVLISYAAIYAPAWKQCYEAVGEILAGRLPAPPLVMLKCPRAKGRNFDKMPLKSVKTTRLRQEIGFLRWWKLQGARLEERQQQQEAYHKECEARGLLLECECCFGEHIPETTIQCAAGHLFCSACAKQYVETQLSGEGGMPRLVCTSISGCRAQLPRSELARVLSAALLASFDQRLEKASIEAALLRGAITVEKCPFCDFVMEMDLPPEDNKVFVCQSEQCGKESCRLCNEENHIPKRCSEMEKKAQTGHRVTVEESMSAALIRECLSCKAKGVASRFVKEDGCNKMTCPKCHGFVCYQCNEMIEKKVGYGHFCQHPLDPGKACSKCSKCPLWLGSGKELQKAEEARVHAAGLVADASYRSGHSSEELQDDLGVLAGATSSPAKRAREAAKAKAQVKAAAGPGVAPGEPLAKRSRFGVGFF